MSFAPPFWTPSQADAILFDWDGVIADTHLDFNGVRQRFYGGRRAMLIEDAHALPADEREALMRELERLEMEGAAVAEPVPGIGNILKWVETQGIPWAVVSRNCRASIVAAAERIGVALPPIVRTRDDEGALKPDPRALTETCAALGVEPAQTLFVGDFIYDMIGARRAGMRGVLVRRTVEPEWEPWLESSFSSMSSLYKELLLPSQMIPWEYQETERRLGKRYLETASAASLLVRLDAAPSLDAWLTHAASLGVVEFYVPTESFTPTCWKHSPSMDPSYMGRDSLEVVADFLRLRFPFAHALPVSEDMEIRPAPKNAGELEAFLPFARKVEERILYAPGGRTPPDRKTPEA